MFSENTQKLVYRCRLFMERQITIYVHYSKNKNFLFFQVLINIISQGSGIQHGVLLRTLSPRTRFLICSPPSPLRLPFSFSTSHVRLTSHPTIVEINLKCPIDYLRLKFI